VQGRRGGAERPDAAGVRRGEGPERGRVRGGRVGAAGVYPAGDGRYGGRAGGRGGRAGVCARVGRRAERGGVGGSRRCRGAAVEESDDDEEGGDEDSLWWGCRAREVSGVEGRRRWVDFREVG